MPTNISWFPGHMVKASNEIKARMKAADLVLDIRDARAPLSTSNPKLDDMIASKKRLIVLNKRELANMNLEQKWKAFFSSKGYETIFSSATKQGSMKQLTKGIQSCLSAKKLSQAAILVIVVGVPNVGKSSLINGLHRETFSTFKALDKSLKQAKVGPLPGVTRLVSGFKIGERPSTYVVDTPGVMVPRVSSLEVGLHLALIGSVRDSVVGEERLARFLLKVLNSRLNSAGRSPAFSLEGDKNAVFAGHVFEAMRLVEQVQREMEGTGNDNKDNDWMDEVVSRQMEELRKKFNISDSAEGGGANMVGRKLLKLYRSGSLGQFTLDMVPD